MDLQLKAFLKRHRPPVPDPDPGLEDRLMQQITQEAAHASALDRRRSRQRRKGVALGVGLILIGWGLWQLRQWTAPANYSLAALSDLETFMLSSWGQVGNPDDPLADWDWLDSAWEDGTRVPQRRARLVHTPLNP